MNSSQLQNRLYAGVLMAFLEPWLSKYGIKLDDEQATALVIAAPIAFHTAAGVWQKICNAFVLYFPPPIRPTQPEIPASTETTK
jgi:hypothetical protein